MKRLPGFKSIRTTKAYDGLLKALYTGAKRPPEEIEIPRVQAICVTGSEPPASKGYQDAIVVLYGIGYSLKMGLKFGKLPRPAGYFDYKVGALETLWWSDGNEFEIANPQTLRWQAYLMVPAFVTSKLVDEARRLAKARQPGIPFEAATLEAIDEGRSVQVLHVGPYDKEQPTIAELHSYIADHGLAVAGKHHEIYLSDPRKTPSAKLKTVIRLAVRPAARKAPVRKTPR
jgi:hypothetical protein